MTPMAPMAPMTPMAPMMTERTCRRINARAVMWGNMLPSRFETGQGVALGSNGRGGDACVLVSNLWSLGGCSAPAGVLAHRGRRRRATAAGGTPAGVLLGRLSGPCEGSKDQYGRRQGAGEGLHCESRDAH